MAREAHAAHHVHLEHPLPVLVRDVEEGLGLVEAEAIHKNIDGGEAGNQRRAAFGRAEIEHRGLDLGDGLGDRRLGPSIDDDAGTHACEPQRGREPDAPGRARDECQLACQIEIHDCVLPWGQTGRRHQWLQPPCSSTP
jgi:hypothetical protein